jgi:hypothetical protein
MREPTMAMLDHHDRSNHETNRCAVMFGLTWLGFFRGDRFAELSGQAALEQKPRQIARGIL